ncbi:hypothetical protein [Vibrio sp. TRT 29B02]|uniref:hypothetical protein n=1 Tax=Vibrio sp. TRT 29B02 TaxID=3418508 RepID=UPI003CF91137
MDKYSRQKLRKVVSDTTNASLSALIDDLHGKTRANDVIDNTLQDINTPILKCCHNDIATLAKWIEEYAFKSGGLILPSGGIETFGGGVVSAKNLPFVFKARLSKEDKESLSVLHNSIKLAILQSKRVRRIWDKACSARECQELLVQMLDVELQILELI